MFKRLARIGASTIAALTVVTTGVVGDVSVNTGNFDQIADTKLEVSIGGKAEAVPDNGEFQLKSRLTGKCVTIPTNIKQVYGNVVQLEDCSSPNTVLRMQIGGKLNGHKIEYITGNSSQDVDISMKFQGTGKNPYYYYGNNTNNSEDGLNGHRVFYEKGIGFRFDHNTTHNYYRTILGLDNSYCMTVTPDNKLYGKECKRGDKAQSFDINERNLPKKGFGNAPKKVTRTTNTSQKGRTSKFKLMNKQTKRCLIVPNNPSYGQLLSTGSCNSSLAILEINKNGSYSGRPSLFMTANRGGKTYDIAVVDNTKGGIQRAYIGKNPNKSADSTNQFRFLENGKSDTFRLDHNSASRAHKRAGSGNSDCLATNSRGAVFTTTCNGNNGYQRWDTISPGVNNNRNGNNSLVRTGWEDGLFRLPGQKIIEYDVPINEKDLNKFCRKEIGNQNVAKSVRVRGIVLCYPFTVEETNKNITTTVKTTAQVEAEIAGKGGQFGVEGEVTLEQGVTVTDIKGFAKEFNTDDVCGHKVGDGDAYSNDDGNTCYDKYRVWTFFQ